MNKSIMKLEKEKHKKLMLMYSGVISSDEYYDYIPVFHKKKEKLLRIDGCGMCGTQHNLEYNEFHEELYCSDCWGEI